MNTPRLDALPAGLINLADHEALARTHLAPATWAYISGGAGDEHSLQANRRAWDGLTLAPRVLRPLQGGHTRRRLLGRDMAHPVLLAPVAAQRLAHPAGELASAAAASALGGGLVLSMQASVAAAAVVQAMGDAATRGPCWQQMVWPGDRGQALAFAEHAGAAGCDALVLTVDAPTSGARDRERRAGFVLPDAIAWAHPMPPPNAGGRHARAAVAGSGLFDKLMAQAPTWEDVAWLVAHAPLPVLLKGVLHPADARQAVALGVAGLIVSNHGGRTLDTAVATAQALPRIADALQGSLPLLVDGGIRRGTDVLKALALGADAVLIGRPYVYGLANAGARGVAHVLRLLCDELEIAMALCGCRSLDAIGRELLWD